MINPATLHPTIKDLIQFGTDRGWVSFEELNTAVPDEYVDPEKMDALLVHLQTNGLALLNYLDPRLTRARCSMPRSRPI